VVFTLLHIGHIAGLLINGSRNMTPASDGVSRLVALFLDGARPRL
jgi:hypothetical protein